MSCKYEWKSHYFVLMNGHWLTHLIIISLITTLTCFCLILEIRINTNKNIDYLGCDPLSVWIITRHGKRNPGVKYARHIKDILQYKDNIISSFEIGNSSLCAQDIDNLRNSKIDKSFLGEPIQIVSEGYQELLRLGSRLKEALPELLNGLQAENYVFRPAYGRRMYDSARAFIEGLNYDKLNITDGDDDYSIVAVSWTITYLLFRASNNMLLYLMFIYLFQPHATCGAYKSEVVQNQSTYHEVHEYLNSKDYIDVS